MEQTNRISDLATPCFILDKTELEKSIRDFEEALHSNFSKYAIGYSVKTNSLPFCLNIGRKMGCFAEVVSFDEYNLAHECGYEDAQIIYNGPMKSKETFINAIIGGAIVNIETKREIQWLQELPKEQIINIGIRLNINISKVSPEDADAENDNSRFGFSDETEEFKNAINTILSMKNVHLSGLHIHRTAHSRSLKFYQNSILYACSVIRKYNLNLDYLDVGGGFFGIFPNKPTYQQYSDIFFHSLKTFGLETLRVIVEPGNALVASCFSFLSEVIDVKHVEPQLWFVTTDGSRNDIDPFFRKSGYMTEILSEQVNNTVTEQVVSGCTCLEYDRLFSLKEQPLLSVGDRILYKNVGAYTMCLTPMFIRYIPNIYVIDKNKHYLIRKKWTEKEFIQKSTY